MKNSARKRAREVKTTINVDYSSEEIATEQVEAEMKQRVVFGIIPNFYVVYDPSPEPLTTKLKFRLAFKEAGDPITAVEIALLSGAQQAEIPPITVEERKALASGSVLMLSTASLTS